MPLWHVGNVMFASYFPDLTARVFPCYSSWDTLYTNFFVAPWFGQGLDESPEVRHGFNAPSSGVKDD